MESTTAKLLTETRNNVMTETTTITMDAQALVSLNVEMDSKLEVRNAIWEPTMPTPPTNANSLANPPSVVTDMLTPLRNVITLHQDLPLQLAEATVRDPSVETVLLTPPWERIVITDSLETVMFQPLDAPLDAHKTAVVMSDLPPLEILTELWPVPDVSMLMLDLPLDHLALDLSNGWLLNPSKRSLNSKLTNSNTSGVTQLREPKREIVNSLIPTPPEHVNASPTTEELTPIAVIFAHLFPESLPSKPQLTFLEETPLKLQSSNKPSCNWLPWLSVSLSTSQPTMELEPTLLPLLLVKLKLSIPEVLLILTMLSIF